MALSVLKTFIIARVDYAFSNKMISRQIFGDVIEQDKDICKNKIEPTYPPEDKLTDEPVQLPSIDKFFNNI